VWLPTSVGSGKEGGSGISGILMGTWNQGCFSGFTGSGSVGGSGTSMGGSGTSGGFQPSPPPQSKLWPSCTDWQKREQGSVASHTQQVSLRWTFERWAGGKEGTAAFTGPLMPMSRLSPLKRRWPEACAPALRRAGGGTCT
jgi:hypothetical protein